MNVLNFKDVSDLRGNGFKGKEAQDGSSIRMGVQFVKKTQKTSTNVFFGPDVLATIGFNEGDKLRIQYDEKQLKMFITIWKAGDPSTGYSVYKPTPVAKRLKTSFTNFKGMPFSNAKKSVAVQEVGYQHFKGGLLIDWCK